MNLDVRVAGTQGPLIGAAANRPFRADHPDPATAGDVQGSSGSRLDHADNGEPMACRQVVERHRRCRIAGHHQQFDPLPDQKTSGFLGIAGHRLRTLGTIGDPGGIAKIDQLFPRQLVTQFPQDGQAANPGIKNADRALWHASPPSATVPERTITLVPNLSKSQELWTILPFIDRSKPAILKH